MGPLSALEQFLCSGLALRTQTHVRATHGRALSSFHASVPMPRGRGGRSGVREGADNSELRTRQSRLLAEVLHLINGSRLHCALNHAKIKKLVSFKITGGRGQLFSHFQSWWKPEMTPPQPQQDLWAPSLVWCFPPCCRLSDAALACHSVLPPSFIQLFLVICCYCSIFSKPHYHINYHLSHTFWFPLISHLHQAHNASALLNYSGNNLKQKGLIHF